MLCGIVRRWFTTVDVYKIGGWILYKSISCLNPSEIIRKCKVARRFQIFNIIEFMFNNQHQLELQNLLFGRFFFDRSKQVLLSNFINKAITAAPKAIKWKGQHDIHTHTVSLLVHTAYIVFVNTVRSNNTIVPTISRAPLHSKTVVFLFVYTLKEQYNAEPLFLCGLIISEGNNIKRYKRKHTHTHTYQNDMECNKNSLATTRYIHNIYKHIHNIHSMA